MNSIIYIIFGLLGLLLLISIIWRFISQRSTLPCPAWLSWMVEMENPFSQIARAVTIIKHLELQPGMKVVDIGCGPGRLAIPVAQAIGQTAHLVAMDLQEGMLAKVRKKARALNIANISFLHAGIGQQKLEHSTFDRALMVAVLGEIPDQKSALQEVFNALKPGGILSITEVIGDPHYQRMVSVAQLVTSIGFREKATFSDWFAYTKNFEKPI